MHSRVRWRRCLAEWVQKGQKLYSQNTLLRIEKNNFSFYFRKIQVFRNFWSSWEKIFVNVVKTSFLVFSWPTKDSWNIVPSINRNTVGKHRLSKRWFLAEWFHLIILLRRKILEKYLNWVEVNDFISTNNNDFFEFF